MDCSSNLVGLLCKQIITIMAEIQTMIQYQGNIRKMRTTLDDVVRYQLPIGDDLVPLNEWIGHSVILRHEGAIHCVACGRKSNKSFNQGYCYPCFRALPECDQCIIKPELCHYAEGSCRDASWGEAHCLQDHYVYLANSSGVKVGITRGTQIPTRWMDQGAVQALPIFRVKDRLTSGLIEVVLKTEVADKTSWQRMLKGSPEPVDLIDQRDQLLERCREALDAVIERQGEGAITPLPDEQVVEINYPVEEYPTKVKSFNFDKTPEVSGILMGIKGQYLILDTGVLNVRKFGGYQLVLECGS